MQRPLELCSWKDLEALPPVGKEYQQRYKLVNDRLPKGRQRLHRAAEYQRGIDGRARNNASTAQWGVGLGRLHNSLTVLIAAPATALLISCTTCETMSNRIAKAFSVTGLIAFGTTTSLFAKIGMTLCLPLAFWQEHQKQKRHVSDAEVPLINDQQEVTKPRSKLRETLLLAIPTFFDLLATILMNIGLLWVTASVYQMMRGAEMLFAALFTVVFLGRKLNRFHLGGIACCIVGVICVGTSSYLSGSSTQVVTPEQNLCGMALIVISQAVQAAQLTFEDFFMADMDIPAMKIVGFEGLFGVIGTLGIMAPIAYFLPGTEGEGLHEDGLDTLQMIRNSRALQIILAIDMVALLMYNVSGMMVTGHLGAVFRTVLETTRTLFVWLLGLVLYYTPLGMGKLGEQWNQYSYLQAFGFAVLVSGTLVYSRGDEEGYKQELAEALAVQAAQEPVAPPPEQGGSVKPTAGSTPITMGYGLPAVPPSMPMDMASGSFKASHTIMSGSYSRSLHHRRLHGPADE
ncbi:hypothetical protein QJQ45_009879 [Haematococcus lacustris]|nr:hypothetical protein QJQ45_005434 [Haematococcus lacustris]KAJ9526400.1 hypothetical protein QJQ45_009879 [Haematococcus lacustris]